ncbi:MAG: ribose transport system permease protein [Thermomicrobiales bacterium]|nr:ribose transport system permease protein [Thermomicrobiales bacterium]
MAKVETPPAAPARPIDVRSLRDRVNFAWTYIFLVLLGLIAIFSVWHGEKFFDATNFRNIALDASQLMLLAVGMTFVIITAGIDLSVSSVLVFSAIVGAKVMSRFSGRPEEVRQYVFPNQEVGIPIGLVAAVLCGLGWGIINGLLITRLRLPPFIVTLGTLGMALGLAQIISNGQSVTGVPYDVQKYVGARRILGDHVPILVLVTAVVVAWAVVALTMTQFGRYTFAIGSNAAAARRAGIDVDRHLLKVYALSGFLAGLAGAMDVARFATASVVTHSADNLNAISAVVIGGTSLFGGVGSIIGSVVGAFIPAVLRTGLIIGGVDPFWQQVLIGAVLVGAVYIDQRRRKADEKL